MEPSGGEFRVRASCDDRLARDGDLFPAGECQARLDRLTLLWQFRVHACSNLFSPILSRWEIVECLLCPIHRGCAERRSFIAS